MNPSFAATPACPTPTVSVTDDYGDVIEVSPECPARGVTDDFGNEVPLASTALVLSPWWATLR